MRTCFFAAAVALLLLAATARAQPFTPLAEPPPALPAPSVPGPRPASGTVMLVDVEALRATLANAPKEQPGVPLPTYGLPLTIPGPDANIECFLARAPVMHPDLAARFPQIGTFLIQSADRTMSGRLELTQRGLSAMLRSPRGTWLIDPWQSADPHHAVSYWMHELTTSAGDWVCHTQADDAPPVVELPYAPRVTQTLRTFRTAVACTGEYGLYHSTIQSNPPNVADPLAAIVTVIARSNVVYEQDLAVRFILVPNNDLIIYTDPDTDPYASSCGGSGGTDCSGDHLGTNKTVLADVIGNPNFDVGHVVTRIFGGVANLSSICGTNKAGGVSGIPRGGDIDPFSALVVIHELGHQFGANHTFSGTRGRCQGNVALSTAWEAGSGSSPMAYAGGCPVGDAPPSDNIVLFADPFFHVGSYLSMRAFLNNINCYTTAATSNEVPVIASLTGNSSIPPGTPFTLTAASTDLDNDPLTYSWEQYDNGVARPLDGTDNGAGALFRIFPPVLEGSRTLPRMADVLSGTPTPGEMLPTVTDRTVRFRLIVRDNAPGAGGVATSGLVTLTVPAGTSPFSILSPTAGQVVRAGPAPVAWSRGGTHLTPISAATVTIRLSTDGGATFPVTLGSFPNTGSATVVLPELDAEARLRLEADGRIFFAMSPAFALRRPCSADFDRDGDTGTDADIEAFFACLAGSCCPGCPPDADFNGDGDSGTDADIEAFFRVLAGGAC